MLNIIRSFYRWLRDVVGACDHAWCDHMQVRKTLLGSPCGMIIVQRCSKCGKFRRMKVY